MEQQDLQANRTCLLTLVIFSGYITAPPSSCALYECSLNSLLLEEGCAYESDSLF